MSETMRGMPRSYRGTCVLSSFFPEMRVWSTKRLSATKPPPDGTTKVTKDTKEFVCALGVLRGSAKGLRKGRFRQPLGGTCFEPERLNFKRLATWILEVPPKVGGHPLLQNHR